MGTKILGGGAEKVYNAAQEWVEQALRREGSLFTPEKSIWSRHWLGELRQRFLNQPDESSAKFLEKLQQQLRDSPPEVYQLMGEALYFYFLIVSTKNSAREQLVVRNLCNDGPFGWWDYVDKHQTENPAAKAIHHFKVVGLLVIDTVLGWSPTPVVIPPELIGGLTPGIANPGQFFHSGRPFQVGFLIEFAEQWKDLRQVEQHRLLANSWEFKKFANRIGFRSKLLQSKPNSPRTQREALLHLVFPDTFEAIVSVDDKAQIAKAFAKFTTAGEDVDHQLNAIRTALDARYASTDHFFYSVPEIRSQWDDKYTPHEPIDNNSISDEGTSSPIQDPWSEANITTLAQELLWPQEHLQQIIEDLQEKRQVIFYGPPGTGKTYVAREIAKQCKLNGGDFEIVQFHPSYSYEDFVQGFRPKLINEQPGFELIDGPLRRIADKARNNPDATFILIIDELNRGNVAKVFGELYFLLEYRDEDVRLQYGGDGRGFSLPSHLWFICTMNTADRSIALMDAALRRRFYFAPFSPRNLL